MELRSANSKENSRYENESATYIASRFNIRKKREIHVGIDMGGSPNGKFSKKGK